MIFGTMFVWFSSTTNVDTLHVSKIIYLRCLRSLQISTHKFQEKKTASTLISCLNLRGRVKQNEKIRECHFPVEAK